MRCEAGQATVEWTGVVLLVSLALGGVLAFGPRVDGRSFGAWLAHEIVCAAAGGCADGDDALAAAYGVEDAALVRRYAPTIAYERGTFTLPVDWRECRHHRCSDAPYRRGTDTALTRRGRAATAFTRVQRRAGETHIQYWLYYPDSTTTWAGSAGALRRLTGRPPPGYHPDDWEAYAVRIDARGNVRVRSTSHGHWRYHKGAPDVSRELNESVPFGASRLAPCAIRNCPGGWGRWTGYTRVSRGSHAGHVPDDAGDERFTSAARLRLVPAERVDWDRYERLDPGIKPPPDKSAWNDPLAPDS